LPNVNEAAVVENWLIIIMKCPGKECLEAELHFSIRFNSTILSR
jgi:hypothetical protein